MAQYYFGLNRGANINPDSVTVGTSTGSTDIELRVDNSKSLTKKDVELLLRAIRNRVTDGRYGDFLGTGGV